MSTPNQFSDNADTPIPCRDIQSREFDWLREECETVDPAMIERRAEYRMKHPLGRRFAK